MAKWDKANENYIESSTLNTATEEISVKEYTTADLWEQAWSMAGKSLFYMRFLWPSTLDWGGQDKRIDQMCYHLAAEWNKHFKDTEENRQWFRVWIEKFQNEVENQC